MIVGLLYFYFFYGSEVSVSNIIADKVTLYVAHIIIPINDLPGVPFCPKSLPSHQTTFC